MSTGATYTLRQLVLYFLKLGAIGFDGDRHHCGQRMVVWPVLMKWRLPEPLVVLAGATAGLVAAR